MKTAALFDSLADNAYIREAELAHNSKRPGSKNPIKSIKYKTHRAYTLKSTNKNTNI